MLTQLHAKEGLSLYLRSDNTVLLDGKSPDLLLVLDGRRSKLKTKLKTTNSGPWEKDVKAFWIHLMPSDLIRWKVELT